MPDAVLILIWCRAILMRIFFRNSVCNFFLILPDYENEASSSRSYNKLFTTHRLWQPNEKLCWYPDRAHYTRKADDLIVPLAPKMSLLTLSFTFSTQYVFTYFLWFLGLKVPLYFLNRKGNKQEGKSQENDFRLQNRFSYWAFQHATHKKAPVNCFCTSECVYTYVCMLVCNMVCNMLPATCLNLFCFIVMIGWSGLPEPLLPISPHVML